MLVKQIVITFIAFVLFANVKGQTGSITPPVCSTVPLIVNTIAKYNDGINLQYWTRLRIKFNAPASNGFILQIRADYSNANFISENLIDEIAIETLDIEAVNIVDLSGGGAPAPKIITLAEGSYTELFNVNFKTNVDFEFTITYRLGEKPSNRLIGVKPGNYNVVLRVNLISKD